MCNHPTRRRVVTATATGTIAAIAGCIGDSGDDTPTDPPDPVSLADGRTCDACGMVIAEGYGPNGQVFYADDYPPDRDGPAWYDSVRELLIGRFEREETGATPLATYVTDYSSVDYELETRKGDDYITGSVRPATFIDATEAFFVVGTGIRGSMGLELLPFGDRADADEFAAATGGDVVPWADVTIDLVESL